MIYIPLTDLEFKKSATIHSLHLSGELRRRLLDLGFAPGIPVTPLFRSPLGDPTAYGVLGTVIALRKDEAGQIDVTLSAKEDS